MIQHVINKTALRIALLSCTGVVALAACYLTTTGTSICRGATALCMAECRLGCGYLTGQVPAGGEGDRSYCQPAGYDVPGLTCFDGNRCTYECSILCATHQAAFQDAGDRVNPLGAFNQGVGCPSCVGP
jgi:hypothetical protein